MTEESTPLTDVLSDTSTGGKDDTTVNSVPENVDVEPDNVESKAEESGENSERLLAGKYKNVSELEKGYKETEKRLREAAEYKKKLDAYEAEATNAQEKREAQARARGFADAQSQQIETDIAVNEFNLYVEALETRLDGESYDKAAQLLSAYQQTGKRSYLEAAQTYFPPEIISQIAVLNAQYAGERQNEYARIKFEEQRQILNGRLRDFCEKNTDWIDGHEERQQLIGEGIKSLGADIDLEAFKSFIDAIENRAIEDFKKNLSKQNETNQQISRIQSPSNDGSGKQADYDVEHWQDIDDAEKLREMLRKV